MIGKTISYYKIIEKLGEGGMGVVYKAQDTKLDRFVALKFLPSNFEIKEEDQARFLQEAKATAAINHPNVCIIHDMQEHEGHKFIILEYIDGKTLRAKITEKGFGIGEAIEIAIQIGKALSAAHKKGIVHRDIKSDNIMISESGQVKVMDFGLAKLGGSAKLTQQLGTFGTISYMSPEQIRNKPVDERSDIFSFGILLYEMLTGSLPFVGEYDSAIMFSIVNEKRKLLREFIPEVSSDLQHIIDRVLEKKPDDLNSLPFKNDVQNSINSILYKVQTSYELSEVEQVDSSEISIKVGSHLKRAAVYKYIFLGSNYKEKSILYLTTYKNHFLKIRCSYLWTDSDYLYDEFICLRDSVLQQF